MDWAHVAEEVIIGITLGLGGGLVTIITMVFKVMKQLTAMEYKVEKVSEVSDLRRQENAIQFRLLASLVKCIKFGTCNGELEEAEKLMAEYFHTGAVR
mgnify:FL=1